MAVSDMKIKVNYFGMFRIEFQNSEEVKVSQNARLIDLLHHLVERHGEKFRGNVFDPSNAEVHDDVLININSTPSRRFHHLATELHNGDEVDILPLFSGGG